MYYFISSFNKYTHKNKKSTARVTVFQYINIPFINNYTQKKKGKLSNHNITRASLI